MVFKDFMATCEMDHLAVHFHRIQGTGMPVFLRYVFRLLRGVNVVQ